jgi:predicted hydrolase (HD superfamily)
MKCEEIGLDFSEFAQIAIDSMEKVASEIGLSA